MRLTNAANVSKWTGKTWNVMGDSITEHNVKTNFNYQDYIAQKIGCKVNNYGISGTGWRTPSTSGGTNAFHQRVSAMAANADLISVFGGTNDWEEIGITMALGAYGDTNPTVSFYGAADSVINQLISRYPTKTIAVFTPIQRNNNWTAHGTSGVTMENIADAIIKVCNKYGIPVLDLYRYGNVYANNTTYRTNALPDGVHPNDTGHKAMADKILAFLNTL